MMSLLKSLNLTNNVSNTSSNSFIMSAVTVSSILMLMLLILHRAGFQIISFKHEILVDTCGWLLSKRTVDVNKILFIVLCFAFPIN